MSTENSSTRFEQSTALPADSPTLIEGLPGLGMVASITVDQITRQLDLDQHGTLVSDDFPPVAAFDDGRVRDAVRVYAGSNPAVMTLQSDVAVPPTAIESLSECVLNDLADEFGRAVFLAGAPAETEAEIGNIVGIATTDELEDELVDADITLAEGSGVISGITGGLLADCYHEGVPAVALVVHANPYIPDPEAARAVIEAALEPFVAFDIDTTELQEQAEEIQRQKQQVAKQLQQYQQQQEQQQQPEGPSMYQ